MQDTKAGMKEMRREHNILDSKLGILKKEKWLLAAEHGQNKGQKLKKVEV